MQVAYRPPLMINYMAFTIKGLCVYEPILCKLCMRVAYWPQLMICLMVFKIKGQTKAATAFKGSFGVYGLILFKLCMQVAYGPLLTICFTIKGQTKATAAFKVKLVFMDQFCPYFACRWFIGHS